MSSKTFSIFLAYCYLLKVILTIEFFNPHNSKLKPKLKNNFINSNGIDDLYPGKTLEVKTYVNGDIDPDDEINITTQIIDHINQETYYITPKFKNIQGNFNYKHHLKQKNNKEEYRISGDIVSEIDGDGNVGMHVQNYDRYNLNEDKDIFKKYSNYIKKYIKYIYENSIPVDPKYLETLQNQYIILGTHTDGSDPAIHTSFENINKKKLKAKFKKFDSLGGAYSGQNNGFSYGATNLNTEDGANSFQNLIANAIGKDPISGISLKTNQNSEYVRGSINGEAVADKSFGVNEAIIEADGINREYGYSDNIILADNEVGKLTAVGEINNLSVSNKNVHPLLKNEKQNYFFNKPKNDISKKQYLNPKKFLQKYLKKEKQKFLEDQKNITSRIPSFKNNNNIIKDEVDSTYSTY